MSLSRFFSHPSQAARQVAPFSHPLDAFFGPAFFPQSFQQGFQQLERINPKMDVVEENERVKISLELPALKKEDVSVQLDG